MDILQYLNSPKINILGKHNTGKTYFALKLVELFKLNTLFYSEISSKFLINMVKKDNLSIKNELVFNRFDLSKTFDGDFDLLVLDNEDIVNDYFIKLPKSPYEISFKKTIITNNNRIKPSPEKFIYLDVNFKSTGDFSLFSRDDSYNGTGYDIKNHNIDNIIKQYNRNFILNELGI